MALGNDATCAPRGIPPHQFSKGRITEEQLKEMVTTGDVWEDLNKSDIVSIIFLMTDMQKDVIELITDLDKDPVDTFLKLNLENNWGEKFLEALIVTENNNVIKKLGYKDDEIEAMKIKFSYKEHTVSVNLNRVIKSLYFLCKDLSKENFETLIKTVNEKIKPPLDLDRVGPLLEIYILHWIKQKYISIDPTAPNLNSLLDDLKTMGCLHDLSFYFDDWKNEIARSSQDSEVYNDPMIYPSLSSQNGNSDTVTKWAKEHKRLCIIINEVDFKDKERYKTRIGSDVDQKNLEEAFSGCGFEIEKYRNVKKKEMIDILESFKKNKKKYRSYGSIFLCILSHGSKGQIVLSDNSVVNIEDIKVQFCCYSLQNVFKFVILQSCQGSQEGLMEKKRNKLVTDGCNPHVFMHYAMFSATISNFTAFRHEDEGSWFICDLCTELKEENRKELAITQLVQKVIGRVTKRRAEKENSKDLELIQIPGLKSTISEEYYIPTFKKKVE